MLISNQQTRHHLWNLLVENQFSPQLIADQKELLQALKRHEFATILIDCEAVTANGIGIISRIKVACSSSHVIIFCDKAHLADNQHRELIKEILAVGVYACIMAPFKGWEVISLVGYYSHPVKKVAPKESEYKNKKDSL
jgi:DNA-binding NtrC family response regulator